MKILAQKFSIQPRYSKIYEWGKLITITGSAQVIVQALGLACGILIIRFLPTDEYAFYTIVNSMLGAMTVLADGGISSGIMSQGGRVWQDRDKLGSVLATGLYLRKRFAFVSLIIVVPVLVYLLRQHNAPWISVACLIFSLVPSFYAALSDSLLEIIPKLHKDIKPLQKNQLVVSIGRFFLNGVLLFLFPLGNVAIIANGLPRILGNIKLRRIANNFVNPSALPDKKIRQDLLKIVQRVMPTAIYYSFYGQITVWLLSIFGNTSSIAQIGAIGRISMVLSIVSILFNTLIVPFFAKLPSNKHILVKKLIQIQAVILLMFVLIVLITSVFSTEILLILGPKYKNLSTELLLSVVGACLNLTSGFYFGLSSSRGWVVNPVLLIAINIISIFIGILLFPVTTLIGALHFNIFIAFSALLLNGCFSFYKVMNLL